MESTCGGGHEHDYLRLTPAIREARWFKIKQSRIRELENLEGWLRGKAPRA